MVDTIVGNNINIPQPPPLIPPGGGEEDPKAWAVPAGYYLICVKNISDCLISVGTGFLTTGI